MPTELLAQQPDGTHLSGDPPGFDTENALSKTQGVFALRHWWERFDVTGRVHWYGDYRHANMANFADPENIQLFGGKVLVDLQAS